MKFQFQQALCWHFHVLTRWLLLLGGTITNFTNLIFQQRSNNSYQTDLKTTSFPFGKRSAVMAAVNPAVAINWQLGVFQQSEPTISTIT